MVALPLPDGPCEALQAALWERHRIEVPVLEWQGRRLIRVSCHLYTSEDEIERLVAGLGELLREF
jgi:isopenicillin-N epimerase